MRKYGQRWARLDNTGVPRAKFAPSCVERRLTTPWMREPAYLEPKKSCLEPNLGGVDSNPPPLEPKFPMPRVDVSSRAHACLRGGMTRVPDDSPLPALYKPIQP